MPHLRFHMTYVTTWGQSLWVSLSVNNTKSPILPLTTNDGRTWEGHTDVPPFVTVNYHYMVRNESGLLVREADKTLYSLDVQQTDILLYDVWPLRPIAAPYNHSAFKQCVFRPIQGEIETELQVEADEALLRLHSIPAPPGCRWGIVGSSESLGRWDTSSPRYLIRTNTYEWIYKIKSEELAQGLEYKYVCFTNDATGNHILWEQGGNRHVAPLRLRTNELALINDDGPDIDVRAWRGAGVVIPVFSLRSNGSQGVGDFGDLASFVRWAASVGFKAVQILPINDTTSSATWRDSYPYNGVSVFALHPLYLDMRPWANTAIYRSYADEAARLNTEHRLDYEAVLKLKISFAAELYRASSGKYVSRMTYDEFVTDNDAWLKPYAHYMTAKARVLPALKQLSLEPEFFYFLQYLLREQMMRAHDVAREQGVILKGDIPIGVCPDSVPVEVDRRLFHIDGSAGAPPDAFAVHGQNWGFPTYNWDEMAKDGYAWWRRRLALMGQYFDAYRIDHVLGFFRIWEIPSTQVYGLLGHFRPALPLSLDEIHRFGFTADVHRYTRPFVTADRMAQLQAKLPHVDWTPYFRRDVSTGDYLLTAKVSTQSAIRRNVSDAEVCRCLMDVACEVLFITDPNAGGYHPRIDGQHTNVYQTTLSPADRKAYDHLHDDFFYNRHNAFWKVSAMKKLPTIVNYSTNKRGTMLPCAEDLGMVPSCVKGVLERLNILSLEIQRMPKSYGVEFGRPADNPYLSVATVDTHDMPPIRLWWHEDKMRTQRFWQTALGHDGPAPAEATPDICRQIICDHLASPSILCIIGLQDYLAMDEAMADPDYAHEQINIPANPNQNWNYRMHLDIEQLYAATSFNERLRTLIAAAGR